MYGLLRAISRSTVVARVDESELLERGVVDRRPGVGGVRACSAVGGVATAAAAVAPAVSPTLARAGRLTDAAASCMAVARAGISTTALQCGQRALRPAAESGAAIV